MHSFDHFIELILCIIVYTQTQHRSVLLLTPRSLDDAVTACSALSEALLPLNETFFHADLRYLLQYQIYEGAYPESQRYWVAPAGSTCQAVDSSGSVASVSCDLQLPALCTQSAAYGASPELSTLLSVQTDDLTITG